MCVYERKRGEHKRLGAAASRRERLSSAAQKLVPLVRRHAGNVDPRVLAGTVLKVWPDKVDGRLLALLGQTGKAGSVSGRRGIKTGSTTGFVSILFGQRHQGSTKGSTHTHRACVLVVVDGEHFGRLGRLQDADAAVVQPKDEAANGIVPGTRKGGLGEKKTTDDETSRLARTTKEAGRHGRRKMLAGTANVTFQCRSHATHQKDQACKMATM